ncbi:hypothetical protein [Nocardioides sp. Kera G14]|uniref:hypothetical protein n=1 Tax=Nocardioides sp. Kera G14 TaxID=2884264 RepID=UPI001D0F838F|nr:hypothetical protein [Nocardioides sp. Kera G14]UDY25141.1 hypothetical protein LH076_07580 [Nocardioides sp. Kera G14]
MHDSLRLAWWGTSWLRGSTSPDELLDAVRGDDAQHLVGGIDGAPDGLLVGLGRLRTSGAVSFGLALPIEGDPVGLGGPPPFNHAALAVGEAVVVAGAGVGLVPSRTGAAVVWDVHQASRRQLPDVGEAERSLRAALPSVADALARLEVARWRPEVADELMNLRHLHVPAAPAGVPGRVVELAGRAFQALAIVDLALVDDGGAVSATEIAARRDALLPLGRAARRAVVAAGSPEVWPG